MKGGPALHYSGHQWFTEEQANAVTRVPKVALTKRQLFAFLAYLSRRRAPLIFLVYCPLICAGAL